MPLMSADLSVVISAFKSFVFFILIIFANLARHLLRASTIFNATLGTTDADLGIALVNDDILCG